MLTQTSMTHQMRQEGGENSVHHKVIHKHVLSSLMGITSSSVFSGGKGGVEVGVCVCVCGGGGWGGGGNQASSLTSAD